MKAKITGKSELRLSDLTREYLFDILDNEGNTILGSQSIISRPSEIVATLTNIVNEYRAVFEDENDVEVGTEI